MDAFVWSGSALGRKRQKSEREKEEGAGATSLPVLLSSLAHLVVLCELKRLDRKDLCCDALRLCCERAKRAGVG